MFSSPIGVRVRVKREAQFEIPPKSAIYRIFSIETLISRRANNPHSLNCVIQTAYREIGGVEFE